MSPGNIILIVVLIVIGEISVFVFGYRTGKSTMLEILKDHIFCGLSASSAIKYELDILKGKIPDYKELP